ncbi:MAG: histidinol-phosphatase [Rhodobacteraceae bacterium]|nr:histidinol-phosphatase [Paracoccaceae bacterium]MCY4197015.1 histidinol-phosphatase [Paracoccaceae bacterium]
MIAPRRLDSQLETELVDVAHTLADTARQVTLRHFRSPSLSSENKSKQDWDPVTEADRQCELAMREILSRRRPDDGILGEEFANVESHSGLTWILDPIDGTRSFICGTPVWGVLISVSDDCAPLFGIIDQPYIGERYEGGFGRAVMHGHGAKRAFATRETSRLRDAALFTTFPEVGTDAERQAFERLAGMTRITRYGLDCYSYALTAIGQIDLVVEAGLAPYDVHAPIAVVTAAGGVVTDWSGGPAHHGGQIIAAANVRLHRLALEVLNAGNG